jgi:hypothetical protein
MPSGKPACYDCNPIWASHPPPGRARSEGERMTASRSAKVIEHAAATTSLALDRMAADLPKTASPQAALEQVVRELGRPAAVVHAPDHGGSLHQGSVRRRSRVDAAEGEGEMTMRILLVLAASAFRQLHSPKVHRPGSAIGR